MKTQEHNIQSQTPENNHVETPGSNPDNNPQDKTDSFTEVITPEPSNHTNEPEYNPFTDQNNKSLSALIAEDIEPEPEEIETDNGATGSQEPEPQAGPLPPETEPIPGTDPPGPDFDKATGELYFLISDSGLRFGASAIGHKSIEEYQISKENERLLIKQWGKLAAAYGWAEPPAWMALLFILPVAYTPMYMQAMNDNKHHKAAKKQQKSEPTGFDEKTPPPADGIQTMVNADEIKNMDIGTRPAMRDIRPEGGRPTKADQEALKLAQKNWDMVNELKKKV